jgi:hypothetical protein
MAVQSEVSPAEPKSEKVGFAVTTTELRALEFIHQTHGEKYDGAASVLRDYSLSDAVAFYRRALASLKAS